MATPTSYFQTLSSQDAIAFVTSLQQVKEHLQSELEWMNQQVQQKTMQLQGIETLLLEASTLKLSPPTSKAEAAPVSEKLLSPSEPMMQASPTNAADLASEIESPSRSNGRVASNGDTSTQNTPSPSLKEKKGAKTTKQPSQPKSTAKKSGRTAKKAPKPTAKSLGKGSGTSRRQTLRTQLLPKFAGQSLTDAVAQILADAKDSLHLDQIVTEMYGNLTDEDFQRAKVSLSKTLSVGKQEGKWRGIGDGLYRSNKVATA